MKNKKLFYTLGSIIVLVCLILIGCLSAVTGEIPFFAPSINGNEESEDDNSNTGPGGNFVDIGADGSALDAQQVQYNVTTDFNGTVYFHTYSYGNYHKDGWNNHQEPFYSSYNELNPLYFTSEALENGVSYDKYTMNIEKYNPSDLNLIPYYLSDGPSNNNDYVIDYQFGKKYSVSFTPSNLVKESSLKLSSTHKDVEKRYYEYCLDNYLKVPKSVSSYLSLFMDDNNISNMDGDVINTVRDFMLNYKSNVVLENTREIDKSDLIIDFLDGKVMPNSINYASCATMMYRILGIPSRIAGGYIKNLVANEKTLIDNKDHICWTEIYRKNIGWTPINVTPDLNKIYGINKDSELQDHSTVYKIKPIDIHTPYTGKEVLPHQDELQGISSFTIKNFSYTAKIKGSRKDFGISYSYIDEFHLYNPSGKEVTDNFNFVFDVGIIQVYYRKINLKTANMIKLYDGKNLVPNEVDIPSEEKQAIEAQNHRINKIIYQEPFSTVGRKLNSIKLEILDYDDNDVTDYYYIDGLFGYLEIKPINLTIKTCSKTQEYSGSSLICNEYTYDGLIDEVDEILVVINGRQLDVGSSLNTISMIKITDKITKENKIRNYKVNYDLGTLTVN